MFFNWFGIGGNKERKDASPSLTRLFINPELGRSVRPVEMALQRFVQMIAALFVPAGMLPPNHPFFTPNAKFNLGDVWRETYARLDWRDKEKLPQTIFFIAVWGLLGSMIAWFIVFMLTLVAGPSVAQAQDVESIFKAPSTDKVGNVIDALVKGNQLGALGGPGGEASEIFQKILTAMLGFYSKAILVFASFMVLYHVLMLTVNAAWEGKPLGGADQIWAPLRLVIAIGLLVPLSTNLNAAQYAVLQVAKVGSAMASNVWVIVAKELEPKPGPNGVAFTPSTRIGKMAHDMTMIRICQIDINRVLTYNNQDAWALNWKLGLADAVVRGHTDLIPMADEYVKYGAGLNEKELCGLYKWPKAQYEDTGFQYFTEPDKRKLKQDSAKQVATAALNENFEKLDEATCGLANAIVSAQYRGGNGSSTTDWPISKVYQEYGQDKYNFYMQTTNVPRTNVCGKAYTAAPGSEESARANIEKAAQEVMNAAIAYDTNMRTVANRVYIEIMKYAQEQVHAGDQLGWMMAGSRYMRIAMAQKQVREIADISPTIKVGSIFQTQLKNGDTDEERFKDIPSERREFIKSLRNKTAATLGKPGGYSGLVTSVLQQKYGEYLQDKNPPIKMLADLEGLKPTTYEPQAMTLDPGEGGNNLLLDAIANAVSVDKDYFLQLIEPAANDPLPNIFAFGHALYWIAIGFMLAGAIPGVNAAAIIIGSTLFPAAILMTFVLPMVPMIRFLLATFSWLVAVLEAIVGMPLFALAHLSPKAEGIMGAAKNGYVMLFSIALRPVLLVIGLVCSIILLSVGMFLLNYMFKSALDAVWGPGKVFFLSAAIMAMVYAFNAYNLANASFKLIDEIANKSMQWFGGGGYQFYNAHGDIDEAAVMKGIDMGMKGLQGGIGGTRKAIANNPVADAIFGKHNKKSGEREGGLLGKKNDGDRKSGKPKKPGKSDPPPLPPP